MSLLHLDYIPCDLTRYSQYILPAWRDARSGILQPLREIMASANHFSIWFVFNIPNPLPDMFFAGPRCAFGYDLFRQDRSVWPQILGHRDLQSPLRDTLIQDAEERSELDIWELFSRHLPAFLESNEQARSQEFLLQCLFYTFCCQLPEETMLDSRELIEEGVHLWEEYMARNSQVKELWDTFNQPAPQPLADQLLAPRTYQDYLTTALHAEAFPRTILHNSDVLGFIDHEETVHLITNLPTRERPDLEGIVSGCVRDRDNKKWPLPPDLEQLYQKRTYGELQRLDIYRAMCAYWNEHAHEEFQSNVDTYYEWLHRMEAKMLARFQYAADRGWSMIEIRL
ncbi:hypothetical protein [Dictyobacter formicarum]|uniref:Uncharacterized protein n=1 Tax=Dictyobacter formicarum TaxID=2778368 RepID=A0ABQ3VSB1_9CHLR|nr:hypothetical protein [Dictyobacter formicarum]GHO89172.1 hypothetical protein KSZ_71780 [Dictyobacter formicarum]